MMMKTLYLEVHQITRSLYSEKLLDNTCQITDANNLIFEPYERHISKFIFKPNTLQNINKNQAKVLLINAQNQQRTLSKNTRIGTMSHDATYTIYATTQISTTQNSILSEHHQSSSRHYKKISNRAVLNTKDSSNQEKLNIICHRCNEYFLSGNDLQKHLRAECYSEQIKKVKFQETQKLLERGQIEESTSVWSSPIVLVKKKDKTMRFCIDYRRLNAISIKDAFPLPRIDEIFDQLSDRMYYTKFCFKSGYFHVPLSKENCPKTAFSTRDNHYQFTFFSIRLENVALGSAYMLKDDFLG
ncbi:unnamed protein product [Rotaria sp. Silwood2]|nr:unnamed protein product [Rotaria sp. Silwood2]